MHVFVLAYFSKEPKKFKKLSLTVIAPAYKMVLFSLYTQLLCRIFSLGNQHLNCYVWENSGCHICITSAYSVDSKMARQLNIPLESQPAFT